MFGVYLCWWFAKLYTPMKIILLIFAGWLIQEKGMLLTKFLCARSLHGLWSEASSEDCR